METATIYFSDGKSLSVKENQHFMSINSFPSDSDDLNYASQSKIFKLWSHVHDGMLPSILEVLFNSEYFFDVDVPSVIYNSKSVTRIEK